MAPGYDAVIKCSHMFNLLDARGAISVSERVGYIGRVRAIARKAALGYHHLRAEMGYPLIKDETERERWLAHYADQQSRQKAQAAKKKEAAK